jgi:hypothetical protein
MALSDIEKQIVQTGLTNGKSRQDIEKAITNYRSGVSVRKPNPEADKPGFLEKLKGGIAGIPAGIAGAYDRARQEIGEGIEQGAEGFSEYQQETAGRLATPGEMLGATGGLLRTGLRTAGAFGRAVFAPIGETAKGVIPVEGVGGAAGQGGAIGAAFGGPMGAVIGAGLGAAVSAGQEALFKNESVSKFVEEHPEAMKDFQDALTVGLTALAEFSASKISQRGGKQDILHAPISEVPGRIATNLVDTAKLPLQAAALPAKAGLNVARQAETKIRGLMDRNRLSDTDAARKVIQGKPQDVSAGLKTLKEIDIEGVETYKDLSKVLNERVKTLSQSVDDQLDDVKITSKLDDLSVESMVGDQKVSFNYVKQALDDLVELYTKTTSPNDLARIKQLITKAQSTGLSAKELNTIAREYGIEFGRKAFSARTGEPLTSVNAQSFENVRSGVKSTVRNLMPNDGTKAIDAQIADTITTRRLVDQMAVKVSNLEQQVMQRGLIENIGRRLGQVIDVATFGGLKAFISKLFFPSNVGLKKMNSLDLQNMLQENLKTIQNVSNASDDLIVDTFVQKINDYVRNIQPGLSMKNVAAPKRGSIEFLEEMNEGWQPGLREIFDQALTRGNAAKVQELLPKVPKAYAERVAPAINKVLGKQGASVSSATNKPSVLRNADIHVEDRNLIKKFIDSVRIKGEFSDLEFDEISRLAKRFNINMDDGLTKVANQFEDVLTGKKKVKGTAQTGRNFAN